MKRRRGGFTLLELVVTTSLLGVTVTSIAFLLRFLATHTMFAFVAYRIVLGALVLALAASGAIH